VTRRGRGPGLLGIVILLLLGAAGGAIVLSVVLRTQEREAVPFIETPQVAVEVLNGCGIDGAARRAATKLRRAGFQVERVADADHFHYRTDIVIVRDGGRESAEAVARVLGTESVIEQRTSRASYPVTVVVGTEHPLVP